MCHCSCFLCELQDWFSLTASVASFYRSTGCWRSFWSLLWTPNCKKKQKQNKNKQKKDFVRPCDISVIMFVSGLGPMHFPIQPIHKWDVFFQNSNMNRFWVRGNRLWEKTEIKSSFANRWITVSIFGLNGIGSELTPGLICFVHWWPTLFSLFFLLFCSWCLFISQRLCVNMSIWIKHIVCIYCLFTCIACKNNHSSFRVYSTASVS